MSVGHKQMIVSLIVGILILCGSIFRIHLDDMIQMRIIYWFFHGVEQECYLQINSGDDTYKFKPHFPMEDTYAAGWYEVEYEIPKKLIKLDSFSVELAHEGDTAKIRSIEFYDHSLQKVKYSPSDIGIMFASEGSTISVGSEQINITNQSGTIILEGTDRFIQEYTGILKGDNAAGYNCIVLALIATLLCYYVQRWVERKRLGIKPDLTKEDVVCATVLVTIFVCCSMMSFLSKHYAHADEYVTRVAIDYYLGGFFPPASSSHWQAGARSLHGASRLNEATLYYFFAGKIGWICREFFHIQKYYRMSGLILLGIMLLTVWKQRKKKKYLLVTLCITPQIWYLFSYATSDHWDWFWGFWILIITLDKDSILYRAIEKKGTSKQICLYMVLCAVLFAQMFLGKRNYLIVLALPFISLMFYWIRKVKWNPYVLLRYAIVLGLTLGTYIGIRNIPRVGEAYSIEITDVDMQTELDHKKISRDTAVRENVNSSPAEQQITFWEMLWNYAYMPTPALLFTSAIGYYVWSSLWGGTLYSIIMLLLYIGIAAGLLDSMLRESEWDVKLRIVLSGFLAMVSFSVTLLYCYYVTYQPQGRYILPIFLIIGYAAAHAERFTNSKYYKYLVLACSAAGLWCFGYAGLYTMYQNSLLII